MIHANDTRDRIIPSYPCYCRPVVFIPLFGMGNFTGIIESLDLLYIVHRLSTFQLYGIIVRWRKIRYIERTVGIYKGNILRRRCGNFAVRRRWGSKGWRERGTLVISLVRWIGSGWGKTSHHPAGTNLVKRRGVVTGDVGVVTGDGGGVERWYGIRLNCWLKNWRIEPYFAWLKIHRAYWLYLITARCKNVPCSKMPVRCILIVYLQCRFYIRLEKTSTWWLFGSLAPLLRSLSLQQHASTTKVTTSGIIKRSKP